LSFTAGDAGRSQMIRVTLDNLPSFYSAWNGRALFVGDPVAICELAGLGAGPACPAGVPTGQWAGLGCTPTCRSDWDRLGVIHVHHEAVVPGGTYVMEVIDCLCDADTPTNPSAALTLGTARWGDLCQIFRNGSWTAPDGGVNITSDVVAGLDKFGNRPGAPAKPRADMEPACLDFKINITDVSRTLDAFRGAAYPFRPRASDPCLSVCP
jgi:hypothetical protein